jgi:hypothetical protein
VAALGADPGAVEVVLRPAHGAELPLAVRAPGAGGPALAARAVDLVRHLAPWQVAVAVEGDGLLLRLPCDTRWHRAEQGDDEVCYSI